MAELFIPANETEQVMADAHAGRVSMAAFMAKLLASGVFVETPDEADEGVGLAAQRGQDGALYVPAFTSLERLERFGGAASAPVSLGAMAPGWPEDVALVINPGDPVELVVSGIDLRRAAQGVVVEGEGELRMPAGTSVLVGDPAEEPVAVLEAVSSACSTLPSVAAAYRAQIHFQRPGEDPHLAMALELDQPTGDEHPERQVAAAATGAGMDTVSVLVIDGPGDTGTLADRVRDGRAPFYRREHEGAVDPPANPQLLAAMATTTEGGDPALRAGIYEAFREAVVLVPIREGHGESPEVRAVRGEDGRVFVLAFTDAHALRDWAEGPVRWASMYGRDLASFAVESGAHSVALNPAGPFASELVTAELRALADSEGFDVRAVDPGSGMTSMAVRGDARYELQPSADFPSELIDVVRRVLAGRTDVLRAYPLEGTIATGQRSYTVGLQLAPNAEGSAVAAAIGARLPAGRQLDVIPLDGQLAEQVGDRLDPIWESD